MTSRRIQLPGLTALTRALLIALCLHAGHAAARPQVKHLPRIGYLHFGKGLGAHDRAFLKGLNELGYVDGKTVSIEFRGARRRREADLRGPAAELVRLRVDVIVALVPAAVRAARQATRTIPIVMRYTSDPVGAGLVASLSRPGGNITGVTSISTNLLGKRLELLRELLPGLSRVGLLWQKRGRSKPGSYGVIDADSRLLGITLQSLAVRTTDDFVPLFRGAAESGAQGLVVMRSPIIVKHRKRIADLAIDHRFPAVFDEREFAESDGLMSYGTDLSHLYRRAADYVDRILKGAKPADLPIEQPTKFELVVNLRTAAAIGIKVPPLILLRADQVIE